MKKLILSLVLAISFIFLFSPNSSWAQAKLQSVKQGPVVKSGDTILFTDTVDGDVFLFGGNVIVDAIINGDLIIVGGQVEVNGTIADDLRVVGGQVEVGALVEDNLSVIGGQIKINEDSVVNNNLLTASGDVRLNGKVLNNAITYSESFNIESQANIGGDLKIVYGSDPIINNKALISGEIIKEHSKDLNFKTSWNNKTFKKSKTVKKITTFVVFQQLATLALEVFVGWLLIALLPKLAKKLIKTGLDQPGASIGWGLLVVLLAPTVGVLLTITLIGIPLGVLTFILYGLSIYLAKLVAALSIGHQLLKDKNLKKPYHSFLLGAVILFVLKLIPAIGWLAYFIVILYGLGALTLVEKQALNKQKK